ncbi:alpha/beta hydrolase [Mucilaginibacter sp. SMC90]|uniref:carboxylesterase family protein n=1 Tax=Mucilaginibacter sp. SMC90 TaxID=2929803 RepID=UPI001FB3D090|nr:alpha/beta hydrolase [Mucilaginibacter sp. SMC90]UOE50985.1 alpha/beta hydrolase [Mucilaginibacter sp. SMC90]
MKTTTFLFLLSLSCHFTQAQDFDRYKKATFIKGADTLRYRILYPENYDPARSYPLVMFLHGAGERGRDNGQQLNNLSALFLKDSTQKKYPAIVVFPQCPPDSLWNRFPAPRPDTTTAYNRGMNKLGLSTPERLVKLLMDSLVKAKIADKRRIYIGGLSMGGFGTYDLIVHYPTYFAAAISICGQTNVQLYPEKAAGVPLWIFHGGDDNVIDPGPNRQLVKALKATGAKNVRYTEYPGVMHNSWNNAFEEPGLLPWLFSFKK